MPMDDSEPAKLPRRSRIRRLKPTKPADESPPTPAAVTWEWHHAVEMIRPHVLRLSTPRAQGTGFLLTNSQLTPMCSVATAAHVVRQAHDWEEPMRIEHVESGKSVMIRHADRAVFLDAERDTAAVLFNRGDLPLPAQPLPLTPKGSYFRVGVQIGWLGFPAIATELCFFGGRISAWVQRESAYLVDGVTINGVSGGPAFLLPGMIIGVVTAYRPNRVTGETLPGLGIVRDVVQFQDLVPQFAALDQAQAQQTPPAPPPPSASEPPLPDQTPTRH